MLSWTKRIGWAAVALFAILISWPFLLAVVLIGAGLYVSRKWRRETFSRRLAPAG